MVKTIFTDHANERMFLRGISQSLVHSALKNPDLTKVEDDGDTQFIKKVQRSGSQKNIHVIAKRLPEEGTDAWLIKTVWIRGEDDPNFIVKALRMVWLRLFPRK